ncbi:Antibiotic biosynthesis monooxygenase protein [Mycena venus]|uniref:Antibiotic biosynthesis monooxygenase protein n=1 Tax=Mycena venus TaxID=2733690 RepID=A0A8H6WYG7_9AGAR|nr:Antibiotic biosynthesis monooxygenase protein [Mycena venus]
MVFTAIVHFWTAPGKEEEMKAVLKEAAAIYLKDEGTLNWFIMQDSKDPTAWSVVERYEGGAFYSTLLTDGYFIQSLKLHMENPHFKKFMTNVGPLEDPARERQILTHNEL